MSSKSAKKHRYRNNNKARPQFVAKGTVNEAKPKLHALTSEIYQRDHVGTINFEEAMKKSAKAPKNRGPQNLSMAWDETSMGIANAQTRDGLMDERDRKDTYYKVYCNNQWVSGCVDVISKRFTSGGWECVEMEKGKGSPENEARVKELLLFRNLEENFLQFLRSIATDLLIFGEAFCELVYATDDCKPGELVKICMIDACTMITHFDEHGCITGYTQSLEKSTKMMQFKPEQIVRWWLPDPKAKKKALSPVQRLLDPVFLEQSYVNWGEKFFKQGARPNFHVEMGPESNEVDAGRFIKFFKENYTGAQNAHVPPVVYGGTKLVESGRGTIEMDFDKGQDKQRDKILVVYGVPPAQLSIIETGNIGGGSSESQNKAFNYITIDPIAQLILEQFNYRVINDGLGVDDWVIKTRMADYRGDGAISKITDTEVRNGTLSINEARAERGREPVDGGDVNIIVASREILPVEANASIADNNAQNAELDLEMKKAQVDKLKNPPPPPVTPGQQPPNAQQQQQGKQQSDNGQQQAQSKAKQDDNSDDEDKNAKEVAMFLLQKWHEDNERAKIEEAEHTGIMVGFFLKPDEAKQLAIPGGEPIEQLHCTLTFHGDKESIDDIDRLQRVIADYAASAPTLRGATSGVGHFTSSEWSDGLIPVIALVNVPGLSDFRRNLVSVLEDAGYQAASNFEYSPHITLKYANTYEYLPIDNIGNAPLTFDTLTLAVGDDHYEYPLNDVDETLPLEALSLIAGYSGTYGIVEALDRQEVALLNDDGGKDDGSFF